MTKSWQRKEFESSGRLLDRLVDGALPEAERRQFLLQLEGEPDGWRRCALAFLEAQAWQEAFAPLAVTAHAPATVPGGRAPLVPPSRSAVRWAALAVSVMVAFALGWVSKPGEVTTVTREAEVANLLPTASHPDAFATAIAQPESHEASSTERELPHSVLESVVKSWQQLGYSAERQESLVTMRLRDGSKLAVPVQEVKLRYTGDRTY